ncbi:MAG: hypothetical protein IJ310_03515 [Clostridia bacterium]|nr:hypothetical protein [Clostridia bacterium]
MWLLLEFQHIICLLTKVIKYHWVGFVFGLFGMIWCAGLPDLKTRQLVKDIKNQLEENNQQ